jgi:hypothetical protein
MARRNTPAAERVVALVTGDGRHHAVTQDRKPRRTFGTRFMIVFTDSMRIAATRIESAPTLRVMLILPDHLDFVTFRPLQTDKVRALLNIGAGSVSRAMNKLHELGVIEREGRGPVTKWRLSADYGWNGGVEAWHAHQRKRRARRSDQEPPPERPIVAEDILWKVT